MSTLTKKYIFKKNHFASFFLTKKISMIQIHMYII